MSQKVIKIGSSLGVTIPKAALEQAGFKLGSEVRLEYKPDIQTIQIVGVADEADKQLLADAIKLVRANKAELNKING